MLINDHIIKNLDELAMQYKNADPFPHIVMDNFMSEDFLNRVLEEEKSYKDWCYDPSDLMRDHQVNKFYSPANGEETLEFLKRNAKITYFVLSYLNSKEVINVLEKISGITEIQGDSQFAGGGMHKTTNGGKLSVHIDFNINWRTNLHRRLNLLIYLNKDWKDEYNGHLELWEKDLSKCSKKIAPLFNRAVLFDITEQSFHGHPVPLNTPDDVARYSLALYYYTADRPEHEKVPYHTVMWQNT